MRILLIFNILVVAGYCLFWVIVDDYLGMVCLAIPSLVVLGAIDIVWMIILAIRAYNRRKVNKKIGPLLDYIGKAKKGGIDHKDINQNCRRVGWLEEEIKLAWSTVIQEK